MEGKVIRAVICLCLLAVALGGCSNSEIPTFEQTGNTINTITGTVTAPAGDIEQFASVQTDSLFSKVATFVLGPVYADIIGLAPVAGATVNLVQLSNGTIVATTTTGQNGSYTFTNTPAIGPNSAFAVQVTGQTNTMRAIVTGAVVDISPTSEVVIDAVLDSLGGGVTIGNFSIQEVAALHSHLVTLDTDVTGMTFGNAVQAIMTAGGTVFLNLVVAYSAPGTDAVLRSSDYSVMDFSGVLKDPFVVPVIGALGGVEIGSGQGAMIFGGNRDSPNPGLVATGKFLHDFTSVQDPSGQSDNAFPYTLILSNLLHVTNANRQIAIADSINPSSSVAGIGATTETGTYMIYPLDNSVRVEDDALSVSGMGLRFAARWRQSNQDAQPPLQDLTLLDAPGGAGTVYNQIRLQQTLTGEESGANTVTLTTAVGTATFDSTAQTYDFDEPRDFGSFVSNTVTDSLQLNLADYSVAASTSSNVLSGLYYVPQNGGLVQFRDSAVGTLLGWGSTSSDGERDGEVVGVNMFSGGFADPVTSVERSFSIAIRRGSGMGTGNVSGVYNVVEYAGYLSDGLNGNTPTAFVETGISYGTVSLNGAGGITAGTLARKRATIDIAAARGETGAEPNISGESGTFTTANAGAAGETFALEVDGVTVFSFTSTAAGDAVTAADIQAGLDNATVLFDLTSAGVTVTGTVAGGDLVFTKPEGAAFDIVVTNEFTGTASAAGGFEGADFAIGTHTIDNASPAVPNASGASGEFTTATAGAVGETFSLSVDDVTIFTFTSAAIGDTVSAADIQGGLNGASAALNTAGFTVSGTVAGGNLVFTRADGAAFTIEVINGFSGTEGVAGGFAGAHFATGARTIDNGIEAVSEVANASGASGAFTTATAGAAGQTFSLTVGGVTVFTFASAAIGDAVTAADIQGGLDNSTVQSALTTAGFTVSGTVAGGTLIFTRADGAAFTIVVNNGFSGTEGAAGGFAGAHFATGTRTIANGTVLVANASGASGAFTTATAGAAGQTFSLTVGGVTVYTFTSAAPGDTVTAANIQGGLDNPTVQSALTTAGFTVSGTVAGGNLVFTKTDGAAFTIVVNNGFSGTEGAAGGFAGAHFATGTRAIANGTALVANTSGASGAFTTATASASGQTFSLTVGGVTVFTFTSAASGNTVTATDIQGGVTSATGALNTAGIAVSGTVAGGNLVFTRADGASFTINVVNGFTGINGATGGFAGAQFATGTRTIDNGIEAVPEAANISSESGTFTTATAGAANETFSLIVGGVPVFTFTSDLAGDIVEAANIQGGVTSATGALNTAGITVSGTVAGGNLVFTRADGASFTINVVNGFTGINGATGGFAGAQFATGTRTIDNGIEAVPEAANISSESGTFTTATAGAANETFSLIVGGVPVFTFTSDLAGDIVEAANIQGGVTSATGALNTAGITVSGTVAGGNLVFTRADGAAFTIVVTNGFTDVPGGFAGADFANGTNTINTGSVAQPAVPTTSTASGAFTTATAVSAGQTYSLTVGGVSVFTFTSTAAGQTVTAADVQGGLTSATGALNAAGITFTGTVAGGNLVFTKADGTDFTIAVTNTFTNTTIPAGGFAGSDFLSTGPHTINNGSVAQPAVPTTSTASGAFTTATAVSAGQTYSLTVGGVTVLTFTSTAAGQTVTAADVQGGLTSATGALNAAGITFTGTVAGGNLVFTKADGTDFTIAVTNTFTNTTIPAGGFAGNDFLSTGPHTINNGSVLVPTVSDPSGAFTTATAVSNGQTYSLTVGGVPVFTFTSTAAGQTVTAADIQGGVNAATGALNAAGITVTGTVAAGSLVFTKADGTDFTIAVTNTFSNSTNSAGGFAGNDFLSTGPHTINNGSVLAPTVSDPSGAFATATSVSAGQTYTLSVGGVPVFTFTSTAAGQTVTAADIDGGLTAATGALNTAGITFTGTVAGGNLVFTKADGTPFDIAVTNTFSNAANSAGGFAGSDFLSTGPHNINNGSELVVAVPTVSDPSGAFVTATAVAAGQTYSLTVGGVPVYSFTSTAPGDTVTAVLVQGGLDSASGALTAAGITVSGTVAGGDLVFTKADGTDFDIVVTNTFTDAANSAGGFAGANFAGGAQLINNGAVLGVNASGISGAFESAMAGAAGETFALSVGGVPVFTFTSTAAGDIVTAADIQGGLNNPTVQTDLAAVGVTVNGTVAGGNLVFTRADGTAFDIVVINGFTGTVSTAGGFDGADFQLGAHTVDNGKLAGPAPSLSSIAGQQALSSGSYNVQANGQMTLILTIGDETITASGAVTQAGDFIALATSSNSDDDTRKGRGILILIRRP